MNLFDSHQPFWRRSGLFPPAPGIKAVPASAPDRAADALPALEITRDQRRVVLRAIAPGDELLLDRFFSSLSPTSRSLRFHGGMRTLPPRLLQAMTRWDPQREFALLALADAGGDAVCIGEARYAVGEGADDEREFALAIDDAWQGVGLGSALLTRLTRHARARGVARLRADVMPHNAAMIALALRHGHSLRTHPADPRLRLLTRTIEAQPAEQLPNWKLQPQQRWATV